jgi:hypothetical protein
LMLLQQQIFFISRTRVYSLRADTYQNWAYPLDPQAFTRE